MIIINCVSSIDESYGGPSQSITQLINALGDIIDDSSFIKLETLNSNKPIITNFDNPRLTLNFHQPKFTSMLKSLYSNLSNENVDIFHGHSLWREPVHIMSRIARKRKVPYIISPRGTLEPWSLSHKKFKKQIGMLLYQNRDLQNAICLHATMDMEAESIRKLGYKNPIAIIPNGIKISNYPIKTNKYHFSKQRKILFLSRVHFQKGIENLINAWELIDNQYKNNWKVEIVGPFDSYEYKSYLEKLIQKKNLASQIAIKGPQFGVSKINTFHQSDIFVLPTFSENFGMAIAEALACGIPVVTTKGAPWSDIEKYNAGRWVEIGVEPLKEGLLSLMKLSDSEREERGKNGRRLIEEKYTDKLSALKMYELYEWIINKSSKPDFVDIYR